MTCETCEHYEDDYIDAWYMDRMMTIKGEWCHKTGKAVRFNSMSINECEDYRSRYND